MQFPVLLMKLRDRLIKIKVNALVLRRLMRWVTLGNLHRCIHDLMIHIDRATLLIQKTTTLDDRLVFLIHKSILFHDFTFLLILFYIAKWSTRMRSTVSNEKISNILLVIERLREWIDHLVGNHVTI